MMIRHPFIVKEHKPRMALAGTDHEKDFGDKLVVLESAEGSPTGDVSTGAVGRCELAVGANVLESMPVGALVTIEIQSPHVTPLHAFEA